MITLLLLYKIDIFHTVYSDYSFPVSNFPKTLSTFPPIRIYTLSEGPMESSVSLQGTAIG